MSCLGELPLTSTTDALHMPHPVQLGKLRCCPESVQDTCLLGLPHLSRLKEGLQEWDSGAGGLGVTWQQDEKDPCGGLLPTCSASSGHLPLHSPLPAQPRQPQSHGSLVTGLNVTRSFTALLSDPRWDSRLQDGLFSVSYPHCEHSAQYIVRA